MARQHENLCTVGSESLSPGQRRLKNAIFEQAGREILGYERPREQIHQSTYK